MIIYGTRPVHLKSIQQSSLVCPACEQAGTTLISAYSKHAHIFWVPLFPIGRVGVSQCQHCKQALDEAGMTPDLRREYTNLKAETKVPLWQFSGLGVIAILAVFITYQSGENSKKQLEYLANPAVGDVYEYKTANGQYSTYKVVNVSADSVFVSPNEYETNKMSGINEIDKETNYSEYSFGISRTDLKQMHTDHDIYDINRK